MTTEASTPTQHLPEGTNVEALHQRINQWFLDQARDLLQERYRIAHATLQVEPSDHTGCDELEW